MSLPSDFEERRKVLQAGADAAKIVWETLSQIDVNDHVEKKNNLTYLSWAWAYATIMNHYPSFEYKFSEIEYLNDSTAIVSCRVQVLEGGVPVVRTMWLPVLNYANKPIQNPNAFDVNTARMRCLTKAISMLGLGAYIYAGEDTAYAWAAEEKAATASTKAPKPATANKSAKPEAAIATPAAAPEPAPAVPLGDMTGIEISSEEDATDVVSMMLGFVEKTDTLDGLMSFWGLNQKVIKLFEDNYPEQYERLKGGFSKARQTIEGGK